MVPGRDGMKMQYTYRYKMESPRYIGRVGRILTGTVSVDREYSDEDVCKLTKEMLNGIANDAALVEVRLVSQQQGVGELKWA